MTPVIIGTLLALVALGYVLAPLFRESVELVPLETDSDIMDASAEIDALREIEFDHETGKLSESDYLQLKARYTDRAIVRMKEMESVSGDSASTIICQSCGSRGQIGDLFCSECGNPFKLPVGNN